MDTRKLLIESQNLTNEELDRFKVLNYKMVYCPKCGKPTLDSYYICNCGFEFDEIYAEDLYGHEVEFYEL